MRNLKIIGVDIFLEKRKTRLYVGTLIRNHGKLVFTYDEHYFKAKNVIPLGPEFPLTQKEFISESLFPSLVDRIPSVQNPAYPEYCLTMGVDPKECDPIILLSTIGRKGPSSFIFYPIFERRLIAEDVIKFRESLGLTTREFSAVFEFSQSSLNALERNRILGSEILKRLEIILNFPNVALDFLLINGGHLIYEKWIKATTRLQGDCMINHLTPSSFKR
jgi:HipA-like protein